MSVWYLSGHIQYLICTVSIGNRFPWLYINCFQSHWFQCIIRESYIFAWWLLGVIKMYQKQQSYEVWFLRCKVRHRISCHFRPFFTLLPTHHLTTQKSSRDVIILHKCTKNHNHVMYASWDIEHNRQNFFSFSTIFSPFTPQPLTTHKIKILKKRKGSLEISCHTNKP